MVSRDMRVTKLRSGTVIDHLRPGTAMKAIEVLGVTDGCAMSIGMFFESKKMGRKDILKLENRVLTPEEMQKIAILSPEASVCIIQDYAVVNKLDVRLPEEVEAVIRCNNPKCITNHENVPTRFSVEGGDPLKVRCRYCERSMAGGEIELN